MDSFISLLPDTDSLLLVILFLSYEIASETDLRGKIYKRIKQSKLYSNIRTIRNSIKKSD